MPLVGMVMAWGWVVWGVVLLDSVEFVATHVLEEVVGLIYRLFLIDQFFAFEQFHVLFERIEHIPLIACTHVLSFILSLIDCVIISGFLFCSSLISSIELDHLFESFLEAVSHASLLLLESLVQLHLYLQIRLLLVPLCQVFCLIVAHLEGHVLEVVSQALRRVYRSTNLAITFYLGYQEHLCTHTWVLSCLAII